MQGYKGFYKTETENFVKDLFGNVRQLGMDYFLDNDFTLRFGRSGYGFHFADSISKTMPYLISSEENKRNFRVAQVQSIGEVIESDEDYGCYVARGFRIEKILTHDDIMREIYAQIEHSESIHILGYYASVMKKEEKENLLRDYELLLQGLASDVDENYHKIYFLYQAVLLLRASLGDREGYSDYYSASHHKKEYVKSLFA